MSSSSPITVVTGGEEAWAVFLRGPEVGVELVDWVGSVGVSLLLVAFALNARGALASDARAYHAMNVVGATLSCCASVMLDYLPFVVLEGTWALVAWVALVRGPKRASPTE